MQGVAENFIGLLRGEKRMNLRSLLRLSIGLIVVLLLAGLIADLPNGGTLFGTATGLTLIGAVVGIGLGLAWGRFITVRQWRTSLVASWNAWMRYSIACSRVHEVYRRVRGRPATASVAKWATIWAIVLFVSMVIIVLTVLDGGPAWDQAPIFVAYAALLGGLVGHRIAVHAWVHTFIASLDDLVRRGEIALWGVV